MPRYVVERTFPGGLVVPTTTEGASKCLRIVNINAEEGVTWIHSYVSADKTRSFCVYDAPTPEAIRQVARSNELPVNSITEVSVLDPYFYVGVAETARPAVCQTGYRTPWRPFRYFL